MTGAPTRQRGAPSAFSASRSHFERNVAARLVEIAPGQGEHLRRNSRQHGRGAISHRQRASAHGAPRSERNQGAKRWRARALAPVDKGRATPARRSSGAKWGPFLSTHARKVPPPCGAKCGAVPFAPRLPRSNRLRLPSGAVDACQDAPTAAGQPVRSGSQGPCRVLHRGRGARPVRGGSQGRCRAPPRGCGARPVRGGSQGTRRAPPRAVVPVRCEVAARAGAKHHLGAMQLARAAHDLGPWRESRRQP